MNIFKNNSGSAIVISLVLAALLATTSVIMLKKIKSGKEELKGFKIDQQEELLIQEVKTLLANSSICKSSFSSSFAPDSAKITQSIKTDNQDIIKLNQEYDAITIKELSIDLSTIVPQEINSNYQRDYQGTQLSLKHYTKTGDVTLKLSKKLSVINSREKTVTNAFKVKFIYDDDSALSTCSSISDSNVISKLDFKQNINTCAFWGEDFGNIPSGTPIDSTQINNPLAALHKCIENHTQIPSQASVSNKYQPSLSSLINNETIMCELDRKLVSAKGWGITKYCKVPYFGGCYRPGSNPDIMARGEIGILPERGSSGGGQNWLYAAGGMGAAIMIGNPVFAIVGILASALFGSCSGKKITPCVKCLAPNYTVERTYSIREKYRKKWKCKWRWIYSNPYCN